MRIKMKDIAAMAGVSQSAVSLILNGRASKRIAAEKQQKVLELVAKYNYRSNMLASNLRAKKCNTVGVWMPFPVNQGYTEIMVHLQKEMQKNDFIPLFAFFDPQNDDPEKSEREMVDTLDRLCAHNICGLITLHNHERLKQENIPMVAWNESSDISFVDYDHDATISGAVEYLRSLGHTDVGFAGLPLEPYNQALQKILPGAPVFECVDSTFSNINEIIPQWKKMAKRPTALLVHNDTIAGKIIYHAMTHGIRVPDDLSILSCRSVNNAIVPDLTGFANVCEKGAEELVKMLARRIADPEALPEYITLKQEFREGKSCRKLEKTLHNDIG